MLRNLVKATAALCLGVVLSSCTQSLDSILAGDFGLKLEMVRGNDQVAPDVGVQFIDPITVRMMAPDGTPLQGIEIQFTLDPPESSATILTPSAFTDPNGFAVASVLSPREYNKQFKLIARAAGSSLTRVFDLASPDSSGTLKFSLNTTNGMTEVAGRPFGFIIRALTPKNELEPGYEGNVTLVWNQLAQPSWGGKAPNLPVGNIDCQFVGGVCYTPIIYTANDTLYETKLWVGMPPGVPGPAAVAAKLLTVLPGTPDHLALANKKGGPKGLNGTLESSPGAVGGDDATSYVSIKTNADQPDIELYPAIVDEAGNYFEDASITNLEITSTSSFLQSPYVTKLSESFLLKTQKSGNGLMTPQDGSGNYQASDVSVMINPGAPAKIAIETTHNGIESPGVPFAINLQVQDQKGNVIDRSFDTGRGDYTGIFPVTVSFSNAYRNTLNPIAKAFGQEECRAGTILRGWSPTNTGIPGLGLPWAHTLEMGNKPESVKCGTFTHPVQFLFGNAINMELFPYILDAEQPGRKPILTVSSAGFGDIPAVTGSIELTVPQGPPVMWAGYRALNATNPNGLLCMPSSMYNNGGSTTSCNIGPPFKVPNTSDCQDPVSGQYPNGCSVLPAGGTPQSFYIGALDYGGNFLNWEHIPDSSIAYGSVPSGNSDLVHVQEMVNGSPVTKFTHIPTRLGLHRAIIDPLLPVYPTPDPRPQFVTNDWVPTFTQGVRAVTGPAEVSTYKLHFVQREGLTQMIDATEPFGIILEAYDRFGNRTLAPDETSLNFSVSGVGPSPKGTAPVMPANGVYESGSYFGFSKVFYVPGVRFARAGDNFAVQVTDGAGRISERKFAYVVPGVFSTVTLRAGPLSSSQNLANFDFSINTDAPVQYYASGADTELNLTSAQPSFTYQFTSDNTATAELVDAGSSVVFAPIKVGTGVLKVVGTWSQNDVVYNAEVSTGTITIVPGNLRKFVLTSTNNGVETAGVPFGFQIEVKDLKDNLVSDYNRTLNLNWTIPAIVSWDGNRAVLPNGLVPCTFVSGVCQTPNTYRLMAESQGTYIYMSGNDPAVQPVISQTIEVLRGGPAKLRFATGFGGPAAGARSFSYTTDIWGNLVARSEETATADEPSRQFFGAIVDEGGNYLSDATGLSWTGSATYISDYLTSNPDGTATHIPTKTGSAGTLSMSKAGLEGHTILYYVFPGAPNRLVVNTEHNNIEAAGVPFTIQVSAVDQKGNILAGGSSGGGAFTGAFTTQLEMNNEIPPYPVSGGCAFIQERGNLYAAPCNQPVISPVGFINGTPSSPDTAVIYAANDLNALYNQDPSYVPTITVTTQAANGFPSLSGTSPPILVTRGAPHHIMLKSDPGPMSTFRCEGDQVSAIEPCTALKVVAGVAPTEHYAVLQDRGGNYISDLPNAVFTPSGAWAGSGQWTPVTGSPGRRVRFTPILAGNGTITVSGAGISSFYNGETAPAPLKSFSITLSDGVNAQNILDVTRPLTLTIQARDVTNNNLIGYNDPNHPLQIVIKRNGVVQPPSTSPLGTNPVVPANGNYDFDSGMVTINNLRIPNASDTISIQVIDGNNSEIVSNILVPTLKLGAPASIAIRDAAGGLGNALVDSTNPAGALNPNYSVDLPVTFHLAVYDAERNYFPTTELGVWSGTLGALELSTFSPTLGSPSASMQYFPYRSGSGFLEVSYGGITARTGTITMRPGEFREIIADLNGLPSPLIAGTTYPLKMQLVDRYYNVLDALSSGNQTLNLQFSAMGAFQTVYGYGATIPPDGNYAFINGTVALGGVVGVFPTFTFFGAGNPMMVPVVLGGGNQRGMIALTVRNAPADHFFIRPANTAVNAGSNMSFTVAVNDFYGNPVTYDAGSNVASNGLVTVGFSSSLTGQSIVSTSLSGATALPSSSSVTGRLSGGTAQVTVRSNQSGQLALGISGNGFTLAQTRSDNLNGVTVLPLSTIAGIKFSNGFTPASVYQASASSPMSLFRAELNDIYGNVITSNSSASITLQLIQGTNGAFLGTRTQGVNQGIASFNDIRHTKAEEILIRATESASGFSTSDSAITVTAGPVVQALTVLPGQTFNEGVSSLALAVTGTALNQNAGVPFDFNIRAVDSCFNVAANYGADVRPLINDSRVETYLTRPEMTSVPVATVTQFVSGSRDFRITPLSMSSSARITPATGLSNIPSATFVVSPGNLNRLVVVGPTPSPSPGPLAVEAGTCLGPFNVFSQDDFGNNLPLPSAHVVNLSSSLGQFYASSDTTCTGTTLNSVTLPSGGFAASFRFRSTVSGSTTLTLTDTGTDPVTLLSGTYALTINPSTPVKLGFLGPFPSGSVTAGSALSPAIQVAVQDTFNNTVPTATGFVWIDRDTGPGDSFLMGNTYMPLVNGVATFSGVSLFRVGAHTLRASGSGGTVSGLTMARSSTSPASTAPNTITVTVGPPSKLRVLRNIQTEYSATPGQYVAQSAGVILQDAIDSSYSSNPTGNFIQFAITDNFDNVITTDNSTQVTLQLSSNPTGAVLQGTTIRPTVNGVATFNDIRLDRAATATYRIVGTTASGYTAQTSSFFVYPAPAVKLGFSSFPNGNAQVVGTCGSAITISTQDTFNNNSPTAMPRTLNLSASGIGGTFYSTSSCSNGTELTSVSLPYGTSSATVYFKANYSNSTSTPVVNIGVTDTSASPFTAITQGLTITQDSPVKLVWTTQPQSVLAGSAITTQVAIMDQYDNIVNSSGASITIDFSSNPAGATLGGLRTINASGGVATFYSTITKSNTGLGSYRFVASSSGLPNQLSNAFDVGYQGASKLVFFQQPTNAVAGVNINPAIVVQVQDNFDNIVANNSSTVTLRIPTGTYQTFGASASTVTASASAGVATFSGVNIRRIGTYTLQASIDSTGVTGTSSSFQISPDTPTKLVITGGASITAGACAGLYDVTVQDQYSNPSPVASVLNVGLTGGGAGAFFGGNDLSCSSPLSSVSIGAGASVASFRYRSTLANVTNTYVGTGSGLTQGSLAVAVVPDAASQLSISTQMNSNADFAAGTNLNSTSGILVRIEDQFGNLRTGDTTSISAAIETGFNPGSSTLSGTTPRAAVAGVATFNNLTLNKVGSGYRLRFSGVGSGIVSNAFNIIPAGASRLSFVQQPSNAVSVVSMSPSVTVEVTDAFGNRITSGTGSNSTVSLAFATGGNPGWTSTSATGGSGTGGGTLSGGASVSAVNGLATFSAVSVNRTGTGYKLTASSGSSYTAADSSTFNISAAAPTKLAFIAPTTSIVAGVCTAYVVQSQDAQNNMSAPGSATTVGLSATNGTFWSDAGCTSSISSVSLSPGAATATFYFRRNLVGTDSISITSTSGTSLTGSSSGSISVTPAGYSLADSTVSVSASTLASGASADGGTPITVTLTPRDAFGNLNPTGIAGPSDIAFTTAANTTGTGTFGAISGSGGGAYTATYTGVLVGGATIGATIKSATVTSTQAVTITHGNAFTLSFAASALGAVEPSTSGDADTALSTQPRVVVLDKAGNRVLGGATMPANVTLSLASNSTCSTAVANTLNSTPAVSNGTASVSTGLATASGLIIRHAASGLYLRAASGGLTGCSSSPITIAPGAFSLSQSSIATPANVASGSNVSVDLVTRDAYGNLNPSGISTVALNYTSSNGGTGSFGAVQANTPSAGTNRSAFTGNLVGVITPSATINGSAITSTLPTFNVTPGPYSTSTSVLSLSSSTVSSGSTVTVTLTPRDAAGNYSPTGISTMSQVGFTSTGPGTGNFAAATAGTDGNGRAIITSTFTGVLSGATTIGATFATTNVFTSTQGLTVTFGGANRLAFTTQPSATGVAGAVLAQQPVVTVRDAAGNTVTNSSVAVALELHSSATCNSQITATPDTTLPMSVSGTPVASPSVNASSGVATFANLAVNQASSTLYLKASSGSLGTSCTSLMNISPGPFSLSKSLITASGSTVQSTQNLTFTLTARDAFGNASPSGITAVAFGVTSSNGGTGTVGATTGTYQATFTGGTVGTLVPTATINGSAVTSTPNPASFTVTPGPLSTLSFSTQPSASAVNGANFAQQPQVTARDANSNLLGSGTQIVLSLNSGTPTLACTATTVNTNALGVAAFAGCKLTGTVGSYQLKAANSGNTISVVSNAISLTPAAATQLVVSTTPSYTGNTDTALTNQPVITARDGSNNIDTNYAGVLTLSGHTDTTCGAGTAVASSVEGTLPNSSGTFNVSGLKIKNTSVRSVRVTDGTLSVCMATFTISPGALNSLAFTQQPSANANSAANFAQQPRVSAYDANMNLLGNGTPITLTVTGGGPSISCSSAVNTVSGVSTFSGCALTGATGSYTLTATSGTRTATSNAITLASGVATQLVVTTTPSTTGNTDTALVTQPVVTARDSANNPAAAYASTISFKGYSDTGCSTEVASSVTGTPSNASGVVTFSGLRVLKTSVRSIKATDGTLSSACLSTFTISPGALNSLAFTTQPSSSAVSGSAFGTSPSVTAYDANSNVLGSGTSITLSLTSGTPTLSCTSMSVSTNSSGVSAFAGCSLSGSTGSYTLTATSGSRTVVSSAISLGAGSVSQLVMTTQPSATSNTDAAFSTQPVVTARDAWGNTATSYGSSVTLRGYSDASCGTEVASSISGGVVTAASGMATYSTSRALKTTVVAVRADDGTRNTACVSGLTVNPGAVNTVTFTTAPSSSASSGQAFAQQPAITLRDTNSNILGSGTGVTLSVSPATATLACTTNPINTTSGVSTFSGCMLTGTAGTYTLTATSSGKTATANVSLSFGSLSQLAITTTPTKTGNTDTALSTQPVVRAQDASGNTVTSYSGTVGFKGYSDGTCTTEVAGSVVGTPSNSSGTISFTGVRILKTSVVAIRAVDGTVQSACMNGFTLSPGALSTLAFTTQPSSSVSAGVAFATQPQVSGYDANGNLVGSSTSITLSSNDGGMTLSCTANPVTTSSGVSSFSGCSLSGAAGTYTLKAQSGAVQVNSANLTVGGGVQKKLAYVSPASPVTAGQCTSFTVKVQDQWNNDTISGAAYTLNLSDGSAGGSFHNTAGCGAAAISSVSLASSTSQQTFWYKNSTAGTPTLTVSATGLTSATHNLTVGSASASKLAFTTGPASRTAGQAQPTLVVQVQDAFGNAVSVTDSVTLSLSANPGGDSFSSVTQSTNAQGAASFTGVSLTKSGTGYQITASSSGGFTSAVSSSFNITAASASKLAFAVQPGNATAGVSLSSFSIQLRDPYDNTVASNGVSVSLALSSGTISSGASANTTAGLATFSSTTIQAAGTYALTASSSGLTAVTSSSLTISPAAANAGQSSISATGPVLANGSNTSSVTIVLKDSFGNPISGVTPVLNVSGNGNSVSCPGATNASGSTSCTVSSSEEGQKSLSLDSPAISPSNTGVQFYAVGPKVPDVCDRYTGSQCDYGSVTATTTSTFTFENISANTAVLGASRFSIVGADASRFDIQSDGCSGQSVSASGSCTVQINFIHQAGQSAELNAELRFLLPSSGFLSIPLRATNAP